MDAESAERMQSILDENLNTLHVPGLQAFVRLPDGRSWSGSSGTADLARRIPLRREHCLRVGSTTKTLTAVVILKLVEQGSLSLEDPLSKWFPDYPNAESITIHQLLNHTSGIPDFLQSPEVIMKSILPSQRWVMQDLLDIAARAEPPFPPGGGWHYSNTNYILLGLIAERVTDQPAAQLMRDMISAPLGLTNTHFIPYEPAPRMLVPGFDRDLSRFPGMLEISPSNTSWATAAFTSGALASTADDLGTFYHALFAGELLSPPSMEAMTTFVQADNPGFEAQDGYGLGLMRLNVDGHRLIGHVGEFMGSTAIAMHSPEDGYLMVLTSNLSFPDLVAPLGQLQAALP
jgi:D-alanyl-D-alanine carboxypeptidase